VMFRPAFWIACLIGLLFWACVWILVLGKK
jgi:hypothetical protein